MYDEKELQMGTKIEREHGDDDRLAQKIAMDHLREDPHYYTKLKAAGLEESALDAEPDMREESTIAVVVPGQVSSTKKLSSSGIGSQTKPLTSDNLTAPETQVINDKNTVRVSKTPPVGGINNETDPAEFFGNQLSQISTDFPRTHELIPANIYEGGAKLKKK